MATDGWFPAIGPDGAVARGSAEITVDGRWLGSGIGPAWLRANTLVVKDFDDRLYTIDTETAVRAPLTNFVVQDHAAGGGVWAFVNPPIIYTAVSRTGQITEVYEHNGNNRDRSILLDGKEVHRGIVNNASTEGGYTVWSRYEPREVWGRPPQGVAQKLGDGLFGLAVMTPEGPWVVLMTHTDLRVAPWGGTDGYILRTGEDNNLNPDALWVGDRLKVVWNTHRGEAGEALVDLAAPREPLTAEPPPPPPPPPEKHMRMPDEVYQIFVKVAQKFATLHKSSNNADRSEATARGVATIRARLRGRSGERWVHKTNHSNLSSPSKDAVAYVPSGVVSHGEKMEMLMWDMIDGTSREVTPQSENHHVGEQYVLIPQPEKDWLLGEEPDPDPDPDPGDTHKYIGGGNDTDQCDECGKSRFDPVHEIPASKKPHAYDPGENGSGLCDVCQMEEGYVLHHDEPVPTVCTLMYPKGATGKCPTCGQLKSKHFVLPEPDPDPDPNPGYHEFVGTFKRCGECGEVKDHPNHQKPPDPKPDPSNSQIVQRLDTLIAEERLTRKAIEDGFASLRTALTSEGTGGLLDDLLNPKPKPRKSRTKKP